MAQVYRVLADELDEWQRTNQTVESPTSGGPLVFRFHMMVSEHKAAADDAAKTLVRAKMADLLVWVAGIPTGFAFSKEEVEMFEVLMLDDQFRVLAPYDKGGETQFW